LGVLCLLGVLGVLLQLKRARGTEGIERRDAERFSRCNGGY
jgi:hypothetical protein